MTASLRIAINTISQYIRTLINILLGFYSTRIVLLALGEEDYGIYMLIAGIVGMLSFLTNALSITTQRFLSYNSGKQDLRKTTQVFSNSLIIHSCTCLSVAIVLEICGMLLFDGFLQIPLDRIPAAKIIYHCAITMIVLSIMTAPFRAALIAHENLVFISIIDVLDGFWKVLIAIVVSNSSFDRLIEYAVLTVGIYIFSLLCFAIYSFTKYAECGLPRRRHLDKDMIKQLTSFAGWSLYSAGCIVGRNQGVAIVLNIFYGTIINAAYGISIQVSSAVNYVGSALQTAFSPRISMDEGRGDRSGVIRYSKFLSKVSFLLMAMIGVPIIIYITPVLTFWLKDVPPYSEVLCVVIVVAAILDQLTIGLAIANRAIGDLKRYSLSVDTIKILTIPFLILLLYWGIPIQYSFSIYGVTELFSSLLRVYILKKYIVVSYHEWFSYVVWKSIIPLLFLTVCYWLTSYFTFYIYVFLIEFCILSFFYCLLCYTYSLSEYEHAAVMSIVKKIKVK